MTKCPHCGKVLRLRLWFYNHSKPFDAWSEGCWVAGSDVFRDVRAEQSDMWLLVCRACGEPVS